MRRINILIHFLIIFLVSGSVYAKTVTPSHHRIQLQASLSPNADMLKTNVMWWVKQVPDGKILYFTREASPIIHFKPGNYLVVARHRHSKLSELITVHAGSPKLKTFSFNAGSIQFNSLSERGEPIQHKGPRWQVHGVNEDKKHYASSKHHSPKFVLPAGTYRLSINYGDHHSSHQFTIKPGVTLEKEIRFPVGQLILSGEIKQRPIHRHIEWEIYHDKTKKLPTVASTLPLAEFYLPEGTYLVKAYYGTVNKNFTITIKAKTTTKKVVQFPAAILKLRAEYGLMHYDDLRKVKWQLKSLKNGGTDLHRNGVDTKFIVPAGQYVLYSKINGIKKSRKVSLVDGERKSIVIKFP